MVAIVLLSVNHVLPLLQILAYECVKAAYSLTTDYSPEINFHLALAKGVGVKSSHTPWPRCIR